MLWRKPDWLMVVDPACDEPAVVLLDTAPVVASDVKESADALDIKLFLPFRFVRDDTTALSSSCHDGAEKGNNST